MRWVDSPLLSILQVQLFFLLSGFVRFEIIFWNLGSLPSPLGGTGNFVEQIDPRYNIGVESSRKTTAHFSALPCPPPTPLTRPASDLDWWFDNEQSMIEINFNINENTGTNSLLANRDRDSLGKFDGKVNTVCTYQQRSSNPSQAQNYVRLIFV
jgi:hypothetical protein